MNKYILYRLDDEDFNEFCELIGVEAGENIEDVTNGLISAVCEDVAGHKEYNQGYTFEEYAPEDETKVNGKTMYKIVGVASPYLGKQNVLIHYDVFEQIRE